MSFIEDALKQAIQKALKEIDEQAQNMNFTPTGTIYRGDEEPYATYVEYGTPANANIVEGSAIVLDEEQKALPAPQSQQGSEGKL